MNSVLTQLQLIASLQSSKDANYTDGLFGSERSWAKGLYCRKDDTAFFSACIGFTLIRYYDTFKEDERHIADQIIKKMHPTFELFRNKDSHASYNFWQTKPSKHFPGGMLAHRFKFFMIPDDIDDSAMIHLVKSHAKEEQLALKEKMLKYAIGNLKWPDKPVKGYEKFKVYNTFFVKNMPASFDVCALCNALYFIYFNQLPLNEQDEHSLNLIVQCIERDDHLNRPYEMSPYYTNSVLIIYHIVRFMIDLKVASILPYQSKIIGQIKQLLHHSNLNNIEKLLLNISLRKLAPQKILIEEASNIEKSTYPFFVAGLLGEVSPKWLRSFAFADATHIKYCSRAYAETLWLEHLLLNSAFQ